MNTSTNTGTIYVVTPALGLVPSVFVSLRRRTRRDRTGTGRPARSACRGGCRATVSAVRKWSARIASERHA